MYKIENQIKDEEISRLNEDLNKIHTDKKNLMLEVNDKNNLAKTIELELKRNEEIINNNNTFNKDFNEKDRMIKELKDKIIQMEKAKLNKIFFDPREIEYRNFFIFLK